MQTILHALIERLRLRSFLLRGVRRLGGWSFSLVKLASVGTKSRKTYPGAGAQTSTPTATPPDAVLGSCRARLQCTVRQRDVLGARSIMERTTLMDGKGEARKASRLKE